MASAAKQTKESSSQTPTGKNATPENVKKIAKDLAVDIVHYKSGLKKRKPTSKYAVTMRRIVDEMLEQNKLSFDGVVKKLHITKVAFQNVVNEMYKDNTFNWGRVVSVYALGARMAQHAGEKQNPELVELIAEWMGQYVAEKSAEWIHSNGGWEAFDDFFPEQKSLEDRLWKGLLVTAVGLGALATMVAAR